jgi:hypothetical protein
LLLGWVPLLSYPGSAPYADALAEKLPFKIILAAWAEVQAAKAATNDNTAVQVFMVGRS